MSTSAHYTPAVGKQPVADPAHVLSLTTRAEG
jgi:hypothetical protein